MRTTINMSDELFRQVKKRAAEQGMPLRQVFETAVRLYLGGRQQRNAHKLRWRTESGRMLPGVRLDDRDSLFDLMDGRS